MVPLCVYIADHIWVRACTCRRHNRLPPFTQSATRVVLSILDALTVPSTHYVCNDYIPVPPAVQSPTFSSDCTITWAFHVLQKICHIKISLQFISTFGRNISLSFGIIKTSRGILIKYQSVGGSAASSWYIVTWYNPLCMDLYTLKYDICKFNMFRKSMLSIHYIAMWISYNEKKQWWKCDWTINICANTHGKIHG